MSSAGGLKVTILEGQGSGASRGVVQRRETYNLAAPMKTQGYCI